MTIRIESDHIRYFSIFVIICIFISVCLGSVSASSNDSVSPLPTTEITEPNAGSIFYELNERKRYNKNVYQSGQHSVSGTTATHATDQQSTTTRKFHSEENVSDNIATIRAHEVWNEYETKGEGVTVGIIDSGADVDSHPELTPIEGGWRDFTNGKPEPYDLHDHGTFTAGIVAGEQTDQGVHYGVAPEVNLILAQINVKSTGVSNEEVTGQGDYVASLNKQIEALKWFKHHPKKIDAIMIQADGSEEVYPELHKEYITLINDLREQGTVVVVPAGNRGEGTVGSPGNIYETFSVGATVRGGHVANYSSGAVIDTKNAWGTKISEDRNWPEKFLVPDVAAPSNSLSASAGGGYDSYGGTSAAAPYVLGTVALMESATEEDLSPAQIEAALRSTAEQPNGNDRATRYGYGIIDAYEAVERVTASSLLLKTDVRLTKSSSENNRVRLEIDLKNTGEKSKTRNITWYLRTDPDITAEMSLEEARKAQQAAETLERGKQTVFVSSDGEKTIDMIIESKKVASQDDIKVIVSGVDTAGDLPRTNIHTSTTVTIDEVAGSITPKDYQPETGSTQSGGDSGSSLEVNNVDNSSISESTTDKVPSRQNQSPGLRVIIVGSSILLIILGIITIILKHYSIAFSD